MLIKNIIKTKKYKTKAFIMIVSVILILIFINSMAIYFNVEKNTLDYVNNNNKKVLYQMKYNIDFVNSTIQNLCLTTYYNRDVNSLMEFRGIETYDQMKIINMLESSVVQTNSLVHSIYIYNNNNKTFYSTFKTFKYHDEDLIRLIKSTKSIPVLKPIPRKILAYQMGEQKIYDNVLTYFMYQLKDSNNNMEGAVILNVKMDWLYNNIKEINMIDDKDQDKVLVLNNDGRFIDMGLPLTPESREFQNNIKQKIISNLKKHQIADNESQFFTYNFKGRKYIITYTPVEDINWILIKVQTYDQVFNYVNKVGTNILFITGVFLIIALGLALKVSKGLYKPINKLLAQSGFDDKEEDKDEFLYLEQIYKNSSEQLERYSKEKISNEKIMKMYSLRKLLLESFGISNKDLELLKMEHNIQLDLQDKCALSLIKIDKYKQLLEKYSDSEVKAIKTEITKDADGALSTLFKYEIIDMSNDEIVVVFNIEENEPHAFTHFNEAAIELQKLIMEKLNISLSLTISKVINDIHDLTKSYEEALSNSKYKFVYGDKCIISADMIKNRRASKHIDLQFEHIKNFTEQIRNSDIALIEKKFEVLLSELKLLEYNDMMLSLIYLMNSVKNLVYELNKENKEPINISSIMNSNEIFEIESIDKFSEVFIGLLREIVNREVPVENKRHMMTVETIKEIIETNYQDINLSAAAIASMLKISPSTISRIFKAYTFVSLPEYINTVRLTKAVEWMENSKLSIGEVMLKVGIENESYFYKIFKKKYGATPREFIMQKVNAKIKE